MSMLRTNVLRRLPAKSLAEQEARQTPQDAQYRAERARTLLDDPVVMTAFDLVEAYAIEDAINAKDDDARRHATDRVATVRAVRDEIRSVITQAESTARDRLTVA
jgi:hypothetical protein